MNATRMLTIVPGLVLAGLLAGMPAANADVDTPLVADVTSLDFGNVPVGETRTRNVTLTNTGPSTFKWGVIFQNPGNNDSPFAVTAQDRVWICGGSDSTMAVGETCVFTVTFAPTATGTFAIPAGRCGDGGGFIYFVASGTPGSCTVGENFTLGLSGTSLVAQDVPPDVPSTSSEICTGLTATIVGTTGADSIAGTPGDDVIVGLGGNDTILGLGGNDVVCGGDGDDKIKGNGGTDRLFGEAGRDRLVGGPGRKDLCRGGADKNRARGCEIKGR